MNEVMRQEKKYLMTIADGQKLCGLLGSVMTEDEHNGDSGYRIRSLYFDTLQESDYNDKIDGLELRRKIRLRIYDPNADFAMLEEKKKEGAYQLKRSLRISRADAEQLIKCNYSVLLNYDKPFASELYGIMQSRCYRPKAVVDYQRRAFIANENHIRITLDHHIVATEAGFNIFSQNLNQYPVLDQFNAILEVKYNGFLLSHIKSLVNTADRSELSVSKYCLARSAVLKYQY